MQPNQPPRNTVRQAIILDLSLFILELLDPRKIQLATESRDHALEVPSALVLMLRDSRVGDPTLFLFIYSLLIKTIKKYKEKQIADQRIARLVDSPDFSIRGEAWRITQRLFDEFSSLIDIAPRSTLSDDLHGQESEFRGNGTNYPIRRYDAIGTFSQEDQKLLQGIYTTELNLPVHPLYDLYFSQIYHAQAIGLTQESTLRRRAVALDEETFNIVSNWKGKTRVEENSNIVQASREFLRWFITTYLKNEWQSVALDASLELSVTGVLTGSVTGSLGITLVTLGGGTLLKAIAVAPREILPDEWKIVFFVVFFLLMIGCLIMVFRPRWFIPSDEQPAPSNSPPSIPTTMPLLPASTPTVVIISTADVVLPTQTLTPVVLLPVNATNANNSPNYCLYVVQTGDTMQSVASWFNVSEGDRRNADPNINQGLFGFHQLIKVNAPCCTNFGLNNGHSYLVQLQDNVFRLALNNHTTVGKIVEANKLDDSRYIQFGQMLCIPNP